MSNICQLTGKRPIVGNNVSHSNNKTKRRFLPNLKTKRLYIKELDKTIKVKVSTKAIRTMNKVGVYKFIKRQLKAGFDPKVWVVNNDRTANKFSKRGYRRVKNVDGNGNESYSITYEPKALEKKVRLSKLVK